MYKMTYSCVFLVARKPASDSGAHDQASTRAGDHDPLSVVQTVEPVQTVADSTMSSKNSQS